MVEQIFDRTYHNGRAQLHGGIDRAVAAVLRTFGGFARINSIAWKAPWRTSRIARSNKGRGLA